ncbi:unnamed protein product [Candidula unifasciata]|uniref:Carboxypeptidase Q n=1 Tax=Candidula unifasciata TaxID=100452 RepID=A0A8S3ZQM1_9EUPU|nr:unnamed protein product [Candidula unifasciata]
MLVLLTAYGLLQLAASSVLPQYRKWPAMSTYKKDIDNHTSVADNIIDYILAGPAKGEVYRRLARMTDKFGPRLCGTETLEDAINYMVDEFTQDGLENVRKEAVTVPHWVRGNEKAQLISPRSKDIALLGLGKSIATPKEGITAEALVVRSFDELHARAGEAKGKIVVYNQVWESYGQSVQYRSAGAREAAKVGAVAALVRSAASLSIYSPHTGTLSYQNGIPKIPGACITVEDAELLWRMSQRGENITIYLYMEAETLPDVVSYNVIGEIKGNLFPDEVVLVSGHLDSWDVGQGAMDDGGGAFISWEALSVIHHLGLRPKRTLQVVLWTCEELGLYGGIEYFEKHQKEAQNMNIVMESDMGTFTPQGLQFTGSDEAMKIIQYLASTLLKRLNATDVDDGADLSDVNQWPSIGVPGGSIKVENSEYFYFHHTNGDTMTVQNPDVMDLCTAVWAVTAYALADMEYMLPANRTVTVN